MKETGSVLCRIALWGGFGDAIAFSIRHLRNEKGTGDEICPAIVSGIVTGDAPISSIGLVSTF